MSSDVVRLIERVVASLEEGRTEAARAFAERARRLAREPGGPRDERVDARIDQARAAVEREVHRLGVQHVAPCPVFGHITGGQHAGDVRQRHPGPAVDLDRPLEVEVPPQPAADPVVLQGKAEDLEDEVVVGLEGHRRPRLAVLGHAVDLTAWDSGFWNQNLEEESSPDAKAGEKTKKIGRAS